MHHYFWDTAKGVVRGKRIAKTLMLKRNDVYDL